MTITQLLRATVLVSLLMTEFMAHADAQKLTSVCAADCATELQECRKHADGQAMMEGALMPYQGSVNPAPNINQLDAQRSFQAEVQKRRMDNQLQCEAQKSRCDSACAAPATAPKKSVIFK
ncbi:MAG: hypothetical protein ABL915_02450 [Gallionella sp.]